MASPAVQGTPATTDDTGPATSHNLNLPASIQAGELLVVFANKTVGGELLSFPVGWTNTLTQSFSAGGNLLQGAWKIATGSEGATVAVSAVSTYRVRSIAYRVSGHDPAKAPEVTVSELASDANGNPPSITPSRYGDLLFLVSIACPNVNEANAAPTNYTGFTEIGDRVFTAQRALTVSSGSEDPGAFSGGVTNRAWGQMTLVVFPPPFALIADAGSFVLTGSDAGVLHKRVLGADAGSFSLAGQDAGLVAIRRLSADAGSFTLTGSAAGLLKGFHLGADSGTFTLQGSDASLAAQLFADRLFPTYILANKPDYPAGARVNLVGTKLITKGN